MRKKKSIKKGKTTSKNLEKRFSAGESVLDYFDAKNAIRRVNLDMPEWALQALDEEAARRGIPRQSLIKTWIIDMLDMIREKKSA